MKRRIDALITERGLAESREKAKRIVMAGLVFVDGERCEKPGTMVAEDSEIEVKGDDCPYVSRGGLKLEAALDEFGIDVAGLVCLDIGSSTGGFSDCLLQRGASKVYAVDSGSNQLSWKLRIDERVKVMEQYNFRYAKAQDFEDKMGFACTDVSFISLKYILLPAAQLLDSEADMVCLIKPQFEAGRHQVGRGGVVKDPAVHGEVIENVKAYAGEAGFSVINLSFSPIEGAKKANIEYLMHVRKGNAEYIGPATEDIVRAAHAHFKETTESEFKD
ncbi:MAG: TlyA family RNA methyltransferase [Clostridiales bacterium]|nr:TlyA family RNA methyltransferase [Clostridiales bacterium]